MGELHQTPQQGDQDIKASLYCICRSHEIELRTIVQKTCGQLTINPDVTPIVRTNVTLKGVWIEVGNYLEFPAFYFAS